MIEVQVLLFATLKDLAGKNRLSLSLDMPEPTLGDVRQSLGTQFPTMARNLESAIAAINEEYAFNDDAVQQGDVIAFFPPVSGGEDTQPTIAYLADAPIDHDELVASITVPETGAVVLFSGMVRGKTRSDEGAKVTEYLEYEAYESMAVAKMNQVADEIRRQWPLVQGIVMVQRIGKLAVGQNTILIACSAAHRDDGCFEAAKYGIDRLKEIVPVWKKDMSPQGTQWVEGAYMPTPEDKNQ